MDPDPRATFKKPLEAACVKGEVVITGPAHMHGAFSAKAARESAELLDALADQAQAASEADEEPDA